MSEETKQGTFEGWAVLEIFGHQKYAGYVSTQVFGQAVLFRVDVPALPERERVTRHWTHVDGEDLQPGSKIKESAVQSYTKFFGPGAIYAMTPCSEEVATKAVEQLVAGRPVSIVERAPARPELPASYVDGHDDDRDEADL